MRNHVLLYGLIAGAIMAAMMAITIPNSEKMGDYGEVIGYTTMIVAFLMVYFGIRSYRDKVLGGAIGFGRAFKLGILIALVGSTCYALAWQVISRTVATDFMEKYAASVVDMARKSGASDAQVEAKRKEMADFGEMYKNPFVNVGMTYLEVFPVGLFMALVSAGGLSRRKSAGDTAA